MDKDSHYRQATIKTANDLRDIAQSQPIRELSRLSLPEIDAVIELTAQILPAGNVPGMILSGLSRLPDKQIPTETTHKHIGALFKGVEQIFDRAAYGAFFAGPAAVIWGYQNLLKLAGKDPEASFPEGTWQFYVDYALREDTARHVNETHGFDTLLAQHGIQLNETDRLTAWVMAAVSILHQYDALLEIEWRERVATAMLRDLTVDVQDAARFKRIYHEWELQRPYRRDAGAEQVDYPAYRRLKFDQFLDSLTHDLPASLRNALSTKLEEATHQDLPAYLRQMSLLTYLEPGPYGEARTHFTLAQAQVAIVNRGVYHLIPACAPEGNAPADVHLVRQQIAALLAQPAQNPSSLTGLAHIKRAALAELRPKLNPALVGELNQLRYAPILINNDTRPASLPLTELRQAERGVGDHALTIFHTGRTFVFDQSHIFFDGILGAAMAEILTNEALSWAVYLDTLPGASPADKPTFTTLNLNLSPADQALIKKAPLITPEAGAEANGINLRACTSLRRLFKQRSDRLQLTINDLLVLYRAIHATTYQPSPELNAALEQLTAEDAQLAASIRHAIEQARHENPSMLIPIDASRRIPRERLYPLSIEVPLAELDLLNLHELALQSLTDYENAIGDRSEAYAAFDRAQRTYLSALAGLGDILARWKQIAIQGESASVGAIKLLAHMPPALQKLMDKVPARFEMLNNMLKGREVFSNVGVVVPTSTLTRFITAKDDNEQKQLVWGIITDSNGTLHIGLRDFRPYVGALQTCERHELANLIAQDYLNAYVNGFNGYIRDLKRVAIASRKTRFMHTQRARQ